MMYALGACLSIYYALLTKSKSESDYPWEYCYMILVLVGLTMLWGALYEGFRAQQYFYLLAFIQVSVIIVLNKRSALSNFIFTLTLTLSVINNSIYGEANFTRINLIGPYQVGHKDIYSSKDGVAISVYYPMD